jgi:methylglutaconyl-CoA hydratase
VSASDISVALESAQFGFTEVKLGLIPAVISPFVIERIGSANAYRFFLTGERFGSSVAASIGLVQETVATEEQLNARVEQLADDIAANSPAAVARCKQLIQRVSSMGYLHPETRGFVTGEIASIRVSKEGQEGLSAFFEKRSPNWVITKQ